MDIKPKWCKIGRRLQKFCSINILSTPKYNRCTKALCSEMLHQWVSGHSSPWSSFYHRLLESMLQCLSLSYNKMNKKITFCWYNLWSGIGIWGADTSDKTEYNLVSLGEVQETMLLYFTSYTTKLNESSGKANVNLPNGDTLLT